MLILGSYTGQSIVIAETMLLTVNREFTDGAVELVTSDMNGGTGGELKRIYMEDMFYPYAGVMVVLLPKGSRGDIRLGFEAEKGITINREKIHKKILAYRNKLK